MTTPLIVILDDNLAFRESTAWLLEGRGYEVAHSDDYERILELLAAVPIERPCALLLDIRMPGLSGLEVHDRLLASAITVPVLYMTAHGDVPLAVDAMRRGALTFLEKPLDSRVLDGALVQALSRPMQRHRVAEHERLMYCALDENLRHLTPRENQVLDCIIDDLTNKQIARRFDISLKTVEMHRSRLMHKLGARSAAQLVKLVMKHAPR